MAKHGLYENSPTMEHDDEGKVRVKKNADKKTEEKMDKGHGAEGASSHLEMHTRHAHERLVMHHRHMHERMGMHERHHMEHMHHKGEKAELHGRHHAELKDMHGRHETEHKAMFSKHEKEGYAGGELGKPIEKIEKGEKE